MKKIIAISFITITFSCSIDKQKENEIPQNADVKITETKISDSLDFTEAYATFFWALIDKDEKVINEFIHPDMELCIMESNGALPSFSFIKDIAAFKRKTDNKTFFSFDLEKVGTEPLMEELPKIICAENIYSKNGCFTQKVNYLKGAELWNLPDIDNNMKSKLKNTTQSIQYTVLNTANYVYYFSQFNGKWYVVFIDMRTPCQA